MCTILLLTWYSQVQAYMQKAGDTCDISPQFFLDFPQNFRLRTRNQYCTQAIAWGSTILDGGSTILDGSSTIFCRFSPFFIDFHDLRTFVAIYILSRFTHFFRNFFLAKIAFSATSHVFCMYGPGEDQSGHFNVILENFGGGPVKKHPVLSWHFNALCVKPLRIWEIKNLAKWVPPPPFSVVEIFSEKNIWVTTFSQFHFLSNIWVQVENLCRQ